MKTEWKAFLEKAGAEFTGECVETFGNPEQERSIVHTGDLFCDLSHYGLIQIFGDDTAEFLQGQLTNDINEVSETRSQLSALCTPKGRMLSNFRIFLREGTYYLVLPYELLEATMNRLRMFVLRSKVTLEDACDVLMQVGASGPEIVEKLARACGIEPEQLPSGTDDVVQADGLTIIRVAGVTPRFEIYGLLERMKKLWQALDVNAAPVGANTWELMNIQAGIPVITANTVDAFVPQMTNMQLINGVSFTKGCYTGQEIVARMHYLGKLKRRMYRVLIKDDEKPEAGAALVTPTSTESQDIGSIVSAQINADGSVEALAVIQVSDAEGGGLHLGDARGPVVELLELPYAFDEAASGEK